MNLQLYRVELASKGEGGGEKAIFNLMTQSCPAREQLAGNWKSQWTGIPLLQRDGSTCRF